MKIKRFSQIPVSSDDINPDYLKDIKFEDCIEEIFKYEEGKISFRDLQKDLECYSFEETKNSLLLSFSAKPGSSLFEKFQYLTWELEIDKQTNKIVNISAFD